MTPNSIPDWLRQARSKWNYTGADRPPFAIEPGPGQESVWDYPRPPAVVSDTRLVVVGDPDDPLASTNEAVRVLETAGPPAVYLPPKSIDSSRLIEGSDTSMCEWKGTARYWTLATNPSVPVGWDYASPFEEYAELAGYVSFYPGRIPCTIDGEEVRPQAGGFYGGWITDEIVGPFKGDPGTAGW